MKWKIPLHIAFEPIQLCNAKCFCCPYTTLSEDPTYRGVQMSTQQITQLLTEYGELVKKHRVPRYQCTIAPWRYSDPLVQPNLPLIMQLADQYNLGVDITTNAVSFTERMCRTLDQHRHLLKQIHISVIGHTEAEVWEQMRVRKSKTLDRLRYVKQNFPHLSRRIKIGIKHRDNTRPTEAIKSEYRAVTLGQVGVKRNWLHNRLGDGDGVWHRPKQFDIDETQYIQGCTMSQGRIMREMEIRVNGDVVLCCDDADGKTHYGNVFEDGLLECWQRVQREHDVIYSKKYTDAKQQLICNTCSRGAFRWTKTMQSTVVNRNRELNYKTGLIRKDTT